MNKLITIEVHAEYDNWADQRTAVMEAVAAGRFEIVGEQDDTPYTGDK